MSLAQDYCLRRSVFGKLLVEHPLHMQTLAKIGVITLGDLFSWSLNNCQCNFRSNPGVQLFIPNLLQEILSVFSPHNHRKNVNLKPKVI